MRKLANLRKISIFKGHIMSGLQYDQIICVNAKKNEIRKCVEKYRI